MNLRRHQLRNQIASWIEWGAIFIVASLACLAIGAGLGFIAKHFSYHPLP